MHRQFNRRLNAWRGRPCAPRCYVLRPLTHRSGPRCFSNVKTCSGWGPLNLEEPTTLLLLWTRRNEHAAWWHFHLETMRRQRSEEHTSELQSRGHLVCRLLLEKK